MVDKYEPEDIANNDEDDLPEANLGDFDVDRNVGDDDA